MERAAGDMAKGAGAAAGDAGLLVGLEVVVGGSTEVVYIYLDGRFLAALFDPNDVRHDGAARVFQAIMKSRCKAVTSLLAVMEAVAIVRKKAARSHRCRSGGAEELAGVEVHVQDAAGGMAEFIRKMSDEGILRIIDQKELSPYLELLYGKALEHAGRVVPAPEGDECRHLGVGSCGWVDFWLARAFGAARICTTDVAFADIPGRDAEFGGIAVQLTSAPLSGPLA